MAAPAYAIATNRIAVACSPRSRVCSLWSLAGDGRDHQPPIALHDHRPGWACCELVASCKRCSSRQGAEVAELLRVEHGPDAPDLVAGHSLRPPGGRLPKPLWEREGSAIVGLVIASVR